MKSNLRIIGEVYLQINQQLLANPGVTLEEIKEVHSHHMAIQQSLEFLDKHNWKLVEREDTASSAKHVQKHKSKHIAAIASKLAAEIYDLEILAPNIHTLKKNYTRFLVLQKEDISVDSSNANKASIVFHTDHNKGSLVNVLTKISDRNINLSKLQSMPLPGSDFKYMFHADMEFDNIDQFNAVIKDLQPVTQMNRILGVYKNGKKKI
jgi:prephenate dehydratase